MASYDDVRRASLEYFHGDDLAADTFATKYSLVDADGDYKELTPDDTHRRLAHELARIELGYANPLSEDDIYALLHGFRRVVLQGSVISGVGNAHQLQSISNCFVIEAPHDSYGGIIATDQQLVQIAKRRGGVGFDISTLRPRGMSTNNCSRTSDGIGTFMQRYSNSCREVAQNGRRGALLLSISIHHPQVLDFIKIKRDPGRVTGANISVRLTDEFLNAVKRGDKYVQAFPVDAESPVIVRHVDACSVWDEIITCAHASAEPGLLFWDSIIRRSPADIYADDGFMTVSTNPCGELPLSSYDSCRLTLINVLSYVNAQYTSSARFDYDAFAADVINAQRLMDDVVDLELEKIEQIITKIEHDPEPEHVKQVELALWHRVFHFCKLGRRTGLGLTAVGDAIAALGMKYGTDESIDVVERIYKTLALNAYRSSCQLACERGSFGCYSFERERGHEYIEQLFDADPELREMHRVHGRRNIALLTTSPAGTVSVMTQTTSGIEPAYTLSYKRRRKVSRDDPNVRIDFVDASGDCWAEYNVCHHGLRRWMEITGTDDIMRSPYWNATANDISWTQRVKLQAAAQRWVCHSISSTVNISRDATVDDVRQIYETAWHAGCKGITVYREGCRDAVLMRSDADVSCADQRSSCFMSHSAPHRPDELSCEIHHVTIKNERWTIIVGMMDRKPYEVFGGAAMMIEIPRHVSSGTVRKHKRRGGARYELRYGMKDDETIVRDIVAAFENVDYSAFTRILSLSLRHGVSCQYVVEQLQKDRDANVHSFARVIARVLKRYIPDGAHPAGQRACPSCDAETLVYTEGCMTCTSCAWSKCS